MLDNDITRQWRWSRSSRRSRQPRISVTFFYSNLFVACKDMTSVTFWVAFNVVLFSERSVIFLDQYVGRGYHVLKNTTSTYHQIYLSCSSYLVISSVYVAGFCRLLVMCTWLPTSNLVHYKPDVCTFASKNLAKQRRKHICKGHTLSYAAPSIM
ncbi:unnamed protein product [Cylicocyclus nassatus]|uniref:Uncharacterized protein n=1 Tax=Cylicocyclus nassatus TaxID=53992 RepID=A0AA36GHG8_CYLNA|nr:unnamed protein product [Cylicocyclus nassatus]